MARQARGGGASDWPSVSKQAFWCDELGTYALALDGDKQPCAVRTSNAGQLLFTGIVREDRARMVAADLMRPHFFTGWGIRTVARGEARYNPMSYHDGSIWPHDNALIALGLARYGLKHSVEQVFKGLFDAATYMDLRRLPELFCGFQREKRRGPTLYPVACAPQAWASATPFTLLEAALGLEFDAARGEIRLRNPRLPAFLNEVVLRDLQLGAVQRRSSGSPPRRRCVAGSVAHARPDPGVDRSGALNGALTVRGGSHARKPMRDRDSSSQSGDSGRAVPSPQVAAARQNDAAPRQPPKEPAPPPSVTVIGARDAHGVLGRDVRSPADEDMGRIVDVIVDRGGQVRAAVIDFGGFLGVGSRKIVVDWNALHFGRVANKSDSITLELTKDQVTAAPEYKEDTPIVVLGASGSLQPLQFTP